MTAGVSASAGAPMATLATPFKRALDFANPNQVKVVLAPAARRQLLGRQWPAQGSAQANADAVARRATSVPI